MQNNLISHELKNMGTLDVRFDARSEECLIKDEALKKYQENAYLLGRVFSSGTQVQADAGENDSDCDSNDEELGYLLDKYENSTMVDAQDSEEQNEDDENVNELREVLTEMINDFKSESEVMQSKLENELNRHNEFNTIISKIKTQGMQH